MKVLVTGGAGFIGSNLVGRLVEAGDDVTVLDSFHTGSAENLSQVAGKVKTIKGDCKDVLKLPLPDFRAIYHLGIYSSSPMYRENPALVGEAINGSVAVFELAIRQRAPVVFASSSSIYSGLGMPFREPMAPLVKDYYTEARYAIERMAALYCKLHGASITAMRFFSVYGPHERSKKGFANIVTQMIWNDEFEIYGDGRQSRDFIHVSDVNAACMLAMKKADGFSVYNVGTGRETSFNEAAEMIKLLKPLRLRYKENPIRNYVDRTRADTTLARKALGFTAKVKLEDGLRETVRHYLEDRGR